MAYRKHRYDPEKRKPRREPARYAGKYVDDTQEASIPMMVASRILDEIDFNGIIDEMLDWDTAQWAVSPGDRCRAVVLCTFNGGKRPAIQNVADCFAEAPMNLLFHDLSTTDGLGRYAIADTLDFLHDADCTSIFNMIADRVRTNWRIITEIVHSDTTAQRVWGVYEREEDADASVLDITYGYPKGYPAELRQYMVGMAVGDHGLPIVSKVLDGNTDDSEWYQASMDMMADLFLQDDPIYVADSHLAEAPNIEKLLTPRSDGLCTRFVTRCPKNFDDKLQERVLGIMDEADLKRHYPKGPEGKTAYDIAEYPVKILGHDGRAVVSRNVKDVGKGEKAYEEERGLFMGKLESFPLTYENELDAGKALTRLKKRMEKAPFDVEAVAKPVYIEEVRRGRKPKDPSKIPKKRVWRIEYEVSENPVKKTMVVRQAEIKVFITNIPERESDPERGRSTSEVLDTYHGEWRVEGAFRSLKTPPIADALYLDKPERAEALISLMNVAVLLRGLIQYIMRLNLAVIPDEKLPNLGRDKGRLQRNVTTDYFIQKCQHCRIRYDPVSNTYRVKDWGGAASFFLDLLDMPLENIVAQSSSDCDKIIP